jgi:hypothetical protein
VAGVEGVHVLHSEVGPEDRVEGLGPLGRIQLPFLLRGGLAGVAQGGVFAQREETPLPEFQPLERVANGRGPAVLAGVFFSAS